MDRPTESVIEIFDNVEPAYNGVRASARGAWRRARAGEHEFPASMAAEDVARIILADDLREAFTEWTGAIASLWPEVSVGTGPARAFIHDCAPLLLTQAVAGLDYRALAQFWLDAVAEEDAAEVTADA